MPQPRGLWSEGQSFDGRGEFRIERRVARGEAQDLGAASPKSGAQQEQVTAGVR